VVTLTSYKDSFATGVIQGVMLSDPEGLLIAAGPNIQARRLLSVTTAEQVQTL
jgi:uncharacterized protein YdeI (YjbR/CyaY-like superfamily)